MTIVLVVDDRPTNREIARATLEGAGYQVIEASDGTAALDLADRHALDAVVADVLMPGMDGYEFVYQLRARPATATLPVLFYTANYREHEIQGIAEACGVSRVVLKDAEPSVLLAAVNDALADTHTPGSATTDASWDHLRAVNSKLLEKVQALAESDERFRVIAESAPVGIILGDPHGDATYVNPTCQEIIAAPAVALLNKGWLKCIAAHHRDLAAATATATSRGAQRFERQSVTIPGGSERWITVTLRALHDEQRHTGFLAIIDDVTTEVIAEQERRERHQKQEATARREITDRFASLSRLASGIAHDFNNIINIMMSYTDFASEALAETADRPADINTTRAVIADLERVRQAGKRAAHLSHQMLTIGGKEVVEPTIVDSNAVLREVGEMVVNMLGDGITLRTNLAPDLRNTLIDEGRLAQVLLNLALNARDAMPDGGTLQFDSANLTADEVEHIGDLPAAAHVRLTITDTGTGMSPEVAQRAIEPFFTTKSSGQGTGLGLATSYGLVKQAGGELTIDTAPGVGTAVHLYLPAIDAPADDIPTEPDPDVHPGQETILVVDDEADIRSIIERILKRAGYHVLIAHDAPHALHIAQETSIDALLTDVVMPGMDGGQLAARIATIHPAASTLFMSGYAAPIMTAQGILKPGAVVLAKPFTNSELINALSSVLTHHNAAH